jgi:hypothetical protein
MELAAACHSLAVAIHAAHVGRPSLSKCLRRCRSIPKECRYKQIMDLQMTLWAMEAFTQTIWRSWSAGIDKAASLTRTRQRGN